MVDSSAKVWLAIGFLVVHSTYLTFYVSTKSSSTFLAPSSHHAGDAACAAAREEARRARAALRTALLLKKQARDAFGAYHCEKEGVGPSGAFCANVGDQAKKQQVDMHVLNRTMELLSAGSTIGDFGARLGHYSRAFNASAKRFTALAYDATEGGIESVTGGAVHWADLTEPQYDMPVFDWVFCIEVAEHIPPRREAAFVRNIALHARRGVILSWGLEGQAGHHHVNGRNADYVVALLEAHGFAYGDAEAQSLRRGAWYSWFKRTLYFFRRVQPLDEDAARNWYLSYGEEGRKE